MAAKAKAKAAKEFGVSGKSRLGLGYEAVVYGDEFGNLGTLKVDVYFPQLL